MKLSINNKLGNIVNDGLVLYLDAGIQGSYPGTGTTWADLAGSNNGTLTNGPTYNSANGGSIVFDGANDQVSLPNIPVTSSFTFEAWVNTDNRTLARQYIYTKQRNPPSGWQYTFQQMQGIYLNYGAPTASTNCTLIVNFASTGAGGTSFYIDSNVISSNNTWYHVVATMNNGTVAMYVNGVSYTATQHITTSYSATTTPGIFTPNDCQIGGRYDGNAADPFDGKIAIVRDYNRALSASEIAQNFEVTRGRFGI